MPRIPSARLTVVVAALVLSMTACGGDDGATSSSTTSDGTGASLQVDIAPAGPADEGIDGVESYRVSSNAHTEAEVDYGVRPPPGGPHNPAWANCGFYDEPIADEHVVHDLEHGAVWLAYSPDLPAADVEVVHDLVRANDKTIATPYTDLPSGAAVVASAWARQLVVDSVDDPRLERFVAQYQDGSQAPEAGASCSQSPIGQPIP
jgi:Protein of unknown function (DUF3105)